MGAVTEVVREMNEKEKANALMRAVKHEDEACEMPPCRSKASKVLEVDCDRQSVSRRTALHDAVRAGVLLGATGLGTGFLTGIGDAKAATLAHRSTQNEPEGVIHAPDAHFVDYSPAGHPVRSRVDVHEDWDVVVIGSGAAGLAAALEARRAGARVVLLEKMGSIGGNSVLSEGLMSVPGSSIQKSLGIVDSPALFAQDLMASGYVSHPERVRVLVNKALETFDWTREELGVRWWEDRLEYEIGQSVLRAAVIRESNGSGLIYPLFERAKALGVEVRLRTKALHFLETETGNGGKGTKGTKGNQKRVSAVLAQSLLDGRRIVFHAKRGVVLASGGFSADIELRQMQNWRLSARVGTTSQPGATGEMLREAARIGAWLLHLEYIHCIPDASPDEKGWGTTWKFSRYCAATQGVWVVRQTGKRFVNETGENVAKTNAIFDLLNAGQDPIAIADAHAVRHPQSSIFGAADVETLVARGFVRRYPTLMALAAGKRIPYDILKATIDRYNASLARGDAFDEMGRRISTLAEPMTEGPWYASPMLTKVLMCSGGIATDTSARALSVVDDQPIPGLFAAGEVTGGLHGIAYVGSSGLLDALVFGRIAGQRAATEAA